MKKMVMQVEAEITLKQYDTAIKCNLNIGVILVTPKQDTLRIEEGQFKCNNYNRIVAALKEDIHSNDLYASYLAKGLLKRISEL